MPKLSSKQKRIAKAAPPKNKITGADFKSLKRKKANTMAKKSKLTARQENAMKRHSKHHTKKHLSMMKKLMLSGKTFTESHKMAMKKVGK